MLKRSASHMPDQRHFSKEQWSMNAWWMPETEAAVDAAVLEQCVTDFCFLLNAYTSFSFQNVDIKVSDSQHALLFG